MLIEVKVPVLPESITEATLVTWHKKAGDAVKRDENLIDIETDKVVLELPAPDAGVLDRDSAARRLDGRRAGSHRGDRHRRARRRVAGPRLRQPRLARSRRQPRPRRQLRRQDARLPRHRWRDGRRIACRRAR